MTGSDIVILCAAVLELLVAFVVRDISLRIRKITVEFRSMPGKDE